MPWQHSQASTRVLVAQRKGILPPKAPLGMSGRRLFCYKMSQLYRHRHHYLSKNETGTDFPTSVQGQNFQMATVSFITFSQKYTDISGQESQSKCHI